MSQRARHEARPLLWRTALAILLPLFALVVAAGPLLNPGPGQAQVSISLGVDAVTEGNTATSLSGIQDCVEVQVGGVFVVDAYIRDVQGLIAWELAVGFDPAILEVTGHNNRLFLSSASFDASDPIPDSDGEHFLAVATLGRSSSGSGVLARVTFRAKAAGRSPATIVFLDVNGDGNVDFGPRLNPGAHPLGDSDGNGIFDGPFSQAEVAVGQACNSSEPEPTPPPTTPTLTPEPEDTRPPSDARGDGDNDAPPISVLLTDAPPVSALLTDSPPRDASGERLAPPSQDGEEADDAGGEDETPDGSTGAETPEASLPLVGETPDGSTAAETPEALLSLVGEPPAGLTDGRLPTDADAPQPPGGDSSSLPLWPIGPIAGVLIIAGASGMLIIRSLRQPW